MKRRLQKRSTRKRRRVAAYREEREKKLERARLSTRNFVPAKGTKVSRKCPLDGAGDPPSFSAGVVDPTHSFRDVLVNLTLQLTRREFISN